MPRGLVLLRSSAVVVAIILFTSFFRLGSVTLFDVDEAVFAEATKEMVESGDWITPTYNGENRYDKPILFYWLMAASYKIFGINEFAARFPSAIAGFFLCLAVFLFMKHFHGERNAFHAVISLALSICYVVYSHAAVTDMVLTLFITLSVFSFYLSIKEDKRYIYAFYVFSALAFLTKGLIGIVFPFSIVLIYVVITERLSGVKKLFNVKGIILFLIVAMPWFIAQISINGQEFIQQFFIKHHFKRYTGVISGHRGPFYYYIPVLIIGMFPWVSFLPSGIRNVFREKDGLSVLALIWVTGIFVFFSFSTTKLPNYILPAVPAAAILIASGMGEENPGWKKYSHAVIAVISLIIAGAFMISRNYLIKYEIYDNDWIFVAAGIMLLMAILSFYSIFVRKTLYTLLSCIMILFLFMLAIRILPSVNQHLQGTLLRYSLYVKGMIDPGERIIVYKMNNPSIVFYSNHRVSGARNKNELMSYIQEGKRQFAITGIKNIEILKEAGFILLERDRKYAIFEKK